MDLCRQPSTSISMPPWCMQTRLVCELRAQERLHRTGTVSHLLAEPRSSLSCRRFGTGCFSEPPCVCCRCAAVHTSYGQPCGYHNSHLGSCHTPLGSNASSHGTVPCVPSCGQSTLHRGVHARAPNEAAAKHMTHVRVPLHTCGIHGAPVEPAPRTGRTLHRDSRPWSVSHLVQTGRQRGAQRQHPSRIR